LEAAVLEPEIDVITQPVDENQIVFFTIVARPSSGLDAEGLRQKLHPKTFKQCEADVATLEDIASQLEALSFEVFRNDMTLNVSARGTVMQFQTVFKTQLEKNIRHVTLRETTDPASPPVIIKTYTQEWIAVQNGAPKPNLEQFPSALAVALPPAPLLLTPRLPPSFPGLNFRVPGDVAQVLNASEVHRNQVGSDRATGGDVIVAVIDSGFAPHPFYDDHGYRLNAVAASDASNPQVDPDHHGTAIIANLFACAPDVSAIGVKKNVLPELAFEKAFSYSPAVISFSVGYPIADDRSEIPDELLPLAMQVVRAVSEDIVVVVAAGDGALIKWFPAMMPEAIAVGGLAMDATDKVSVTNDSSSFTHPIFPTRSVPDVCAFGTKVVLPIADSSGSPDWALEGYTSCATPQVAGVCALLLQKQPSLTPQSVRSLLVEFAQPIRTAGVIDTKAGAGLVDAFASWNALS
jgi:serine protease AprX